MKTSLILCSRNRATQLYRALHQLPLAAMLQYDIELVLIDNHSTDNTLEIMQAFAAEVAFRVVVENQQQTGLSHARNRGIQKASGELLVFTDDDCYLKGDYFEALFHDFNRDRFQFCGGQILLWDQQDAMESINYQEDFQLIPPRTFIPAGLIQGANMVVHRSVFDAIGGFDTAMGAGTDMRCEDIALVGRASLQGFSGAFLPGLRVFHHHQRKARGEVMKLREDNDIGRGAYYASMYEQGFIDAWLKGLQMTADSRPKYGEHPHFRVINELKGALLYFQSKREANSPD